MIHTNENKADRIIRNIAGILLFVVAQTMLTGLIQQIVVIVAAIAIVTGVVGFCGIYALLGISTNKVKK